jgi:hypothetical protein
MQARAGTLVGTRKYSRFEEGGLETRKYFYIAGPYYCRSHTVCILIPHTHWMPLSIEGCKEPGEFGLLRTGRVSVVIRRLVHHSWAGTSWKGSAGQGLAISHETGEGGHGAAKPDGVPNLP